MVSTERPETTTTQGAIITPSQTQPSSRTQPDSELNPESILAAIGEFAADRKAAEIVALDLRGVVGYADYFLICSGRSDRQVRAIHDAIHLEMKARHGLLPARVEGVSESRWILMDYLDVVVHIFTPETRERYRLEQLWGEAPATRIESVPEGAEA